MPRIAAPLPYDLYGEGPPLLLLHGALVDRRYWHYERDLFAAQYQVITIDLPGHGTAPALDTSASVAGFAQAVLETLEQLNLPPLACIGHSLGGMVAQELALSAPERLSALLLADTWYHPRGELWELFPFRTMALHWFLRTTSVDDMATLMAWGLSRRNPQIAAYVREVLLRYTSDRETYLRIWEAAVDFSSRARLHQISCPTLVLVSEHYLFTQYQAREMQRRIPGARLSVVPDSSHWVNWDNRHGFAQRVLDFLAQTLPAAQLA